MKARQSGYTIIEVMVFLAISGVLLLTALQLFNGQSSQTQFQQSMRDLESKIRSTVGTVGNSVEPNVGQYVCDAVTGADGVLRATLVPPHNSETPGIGVNQNCLYLGKAIYVHPATKGQIYIYTVLGLRAPNGTVATTFSGTNPNPQNGTPDLTEKYQITPNKAVFKSAKVAGSLTNFEMAGFYNDIQPSNNGDQPAMLVKAYNVQGTIANIPPCIQEKSTCPNTLPNFTMWKLCFQSTSDSTKSAELDVIVKTYGIDTQVKYNNC